MQWRTIITGVDYNNNNNNNNFSVKSNIAAVFILKIKLIMIYFQINRFKQII